MFDVGFSELVLLFIIGLLVLGPEKLPQVANKLGGWVGQARRMTRMLKRQIEEELEFSKVRETVNQPLSTMMDKPVAKAKSPRDGKTEDEATGPGETGHADASGDARERPKPDPQAPAPENEAAVADGPEEVGGNDGPASGGDAANAADEKSAARGSS